MILRGLLAFILCLLLASPSWAQTAHVQSQSVRDLDGNTTVSKAFSPNVLAASAAVGGLYWTNNTSNLSSVTVCGTTATLLDNPITQGSTRGASFYSPNMSAGACTVTATFDAAVADVRLSIHEVSGADTTAPLDGHAGQGQAAPGNGTDTYTSGTMTIAFDGDYIFGFCVSTNSFVLTAGTNFTRDVSSGQQTSEHYLQPTGANLAATCSMSGGNGASITLGVALKAAGAGATPTALPSNQGFMGVILQ